MIRDKFGNGIYELTEEDKDMMKEHNLFYDDLFEYGRKILDSGFENTVADYELTIYSMIYRTLELLDTLKVMTENGLINSGFIVLRALVEIAVQLCYIITDKNRIQEKATVLQMLDIKRTTKIESAFYKYMEQIECYKDYVPIIKRDKPFQNWYSYCEGKRTSIENLFELIGWEKLYSNLYRHLCIETHETNHLETNIEIINGRFYFKPFRMFENHVLLMNSILKIMVLTYHELIQLYGDAQMKQEWDFYEKKCDDYIESNDKISEISKFLNPLQKWF